MLISCSVCFLINERDKCRTTQNSGARLSSTHNDDTIDFFGALIDVIEFEYFSQHQVVLFKCKWFDIDTNKKRVHKLSFYINQYYLDMVR